MRSLLQSKFSLICQNSFDSEQFMNMKLTVIGVSLKEVIIQSPRGDNILRTIRLPFVRTKKMMMFESSIENIYVAEWWIFAVWTTVTNS